MINISNCNKVLSIDKIKKQITIEAGANLKDVLNVLRPLGLTISNMTFYFF